MSELVSAGSKLRRLHPLAGKKELVAHFSENQPNHKRWHRKNRRAPDNRGQSSCELRVRHRNGRDRVDRTLQLLVSQHVENRARDIVDRNPTPPLPPVSQPSTQPHAEGWQHFWQGAANPAHHDPDADLNGTNPRLRRRPGGSFPLPADFSGESRTGPAALAQNFIAAIAVISHRGGRNEDSRALWRLGHRFGQVPSALPATVEDPPLLGVRPSTYDAFPRQVNHSVKTRNQLWGQGLCRIPSNLIRTGCRSANQACDRLPACFQIWDKCRPNRTRSSADENAHAI